MHRKLRMLIVGVVLATALASLAGCIRSYRTTSELSVSASDVVYVRDGRTDLCFAVLAVQNPAGTSVTEMAMTQVPCDSVAEIAVQ